MDKQERIDAAFRCFCDYMDGEGLKYEAQTKEGEDKRLLLSFMDDEQPMDAVFVFEKDAERIYIGSVFPFTFGEERLDDMLLAALCINRIVAVGSFCVDTKNRRCSFESNETVAGVGCFASEYAERIIVTVFSVLKRFGGQLAAVARGALAADDIDVGSHEEEAE